MKRFLLPFLVFISSAIVLYAEPISLQRAKGMASVYMKQAIQPQLVRRKAVAQADATFQPLYIFSRGQGKGYVMVSGDDLLPNILGYTDSGDFDEDNVPPALQDMIDYYSECAVRLQTDTVMARKLASRPRLAPSGTRDIPALMTSHHHQSGPYNALCPMGKDGSYRAATGCVATAASQIIYYWRKDLDDRTRYNTPTYGYGDAPVTTSIPSGTPLKWNLMYDSYGSNEPKESTQAIATLVACVGASAWLTYGRSTSGQISDCRQVFSGQFGMNGGTVTWRNSSNQTGWEKTIINDLEEGHPILYSGVHPSNGGHAVVIDGYRLSDNKFHFNFGWGGQGDGHYTVDDAGMNGFSDSQGMVYGICPAKWNIAGEIISVPTQFVKAVSNTIKVRVTNNSTLPQKGVYLYCLTGGALPGSGTSAQASDTSTEIPVGETREFTFTFKPSSSNSYTIYLCGPDKAILDKVAGLEAQPSVPALVLNYLSLDDGGTGENVTVGNEEIEVRHVYNSKKVNIVANFTNAEGGTLCAPSVKSQLFVLQDGEFVPKSTKTKSNVTFAPGATEDIVYDLSGLNDDAIYKFSLAGTANTDRNYTFDYATADTVIYFKMMGANLTGTVDEGGHEMTLSGNFNATIFSTLTTDANVSRYDLTQVAGVTASPSVSAPLTAANPNALFYVNASARIAGRNIIADGVAERLELTPGYNFEPKEDFHAMQAVYHATQAVGLYGTMYLPFDAATPKGMFARKVNRLKGGYLQEVDSCNHELKSGTPYIIITGAPIDVTATDVDVSTQVPSECTDSVRGTWTNIVATSAQYVLDDADSQNFVAATGHEIPALTAYLEYTKKVSINSFQYSTKDKRARQLAEQIASTWAIYDAHAETSPEEANASLLAAIAEAEDTLHTQPIASAQSAQIKALEAAVEDYLIAQIVPSEDGSLDVSHLILNPSFETGSLRNWKQTSCTVARTTANHAQYMSGADGICLANINKGGTVYQEVSGLEPGIYRMEVLVAADYDNHIDIFAGELTQRVEPTDFGPMYFTEAAIDGIQVTDGTLTIGASAVEDWAKVDNFRLYRTGSVDAIEAVSASPSVVRRSGVYDMAGRKVSRLSGLSKGIYIIDGKKVIR